MPYDILYPVLQRCTPLQLFHLEDCNPVGALFVVTPKPSKLAKINTSKSEGGDVYIGGGSGNQIGTWLLFYVKRFDSVNARKKCTCNEQKAFMQSIWGWL